MGYYLALPILLLSTALQSSVLPAYGFHNGQLELTFVIVAGWAIHASWEEAVFWAFVGGIMQDMLGIAPIGTSAIAMIVTVFGIKWFAGRVFHLNILFLIGFVAIGTVVGHMMLALVLTSQGYVPDLRLFVQYFSIPSFVLNVLATLPIYVLLRRIQVRIPRAQSAWDVNV